MTSLRTSTALSATAGLLALGVLSSCGSDAAVDSSASTTPASSTPSPSPPTATVTTTVTATPTSRTPQIDPSLTTPPPGKDAPAIPRAAQDYGTAFVKAWVERDRTRATQLGTEAAVKAAFASSVATMPRFARCEGAAGSSYCTWEGDEYTMRLRLRNEMASLGQPHAVAEVVFQH
ncbi:MAG: hypothetical protein ABIQ13_15990 [Pedococcus sp.]